MILPDIIISTYINRTFEFNGQDTEEKCLDLTHFRQYPHKIHYQYNSRGFRDQEWPDRVAELKNAIWCFGDSFTTGIGLPYSHIWPQVLSLRSGQRTINVSMDGASNNWIARKVVQVLDQIQPRNLIIHWSFIHRREKDADIVRREKWQKFYKDIKDPSWPECADPIQFIKLPQSIQLEIANQHSSYWLYVIDEERRMYFDPVNSDQSDIDNTLMCIDHVEATNKNTKIIHSVIPEFSGYAKHLFAEKIKDKSINYIPEFSKIDLARDGLHYDIKTAEMFVGQLLI